MLTIKEDVFSYLPCDIGLDNFDKEKAEEIRVRVDRPIIVKVGKEEIISTQKTDEKFVLKLLENFTENSIYAVQSEINSGYITIKGGHRVGISGTCIFENGQIKNIRYISSLNIRIAHEIKGLSDDLINIIYPKNIFENTLIISSPGSGKTTLLRDMIRNLSVRRK